MSNPFNIPNNAASKPVTNNLFNSSNQPNSNQTGANIFSQNANQPQGQQNNTNPFGGNNPSANSGSNLFGAQQQPQQTNNTPAQGSNIFGNKTQPPTGTNNLFGNKAP
jgi:hypothetical protein